MQGRGGGFRRASSLYGHVKWPLSGAADHHPSPCPGDNQRACLVLAANGLVVDTPLDGELGGGEVAGSVSGRTTRRDLMGTEGRELPSAPRTREEERSVDSEKEGKKESVMTVSVGARESGGESEERQHGEISPFMNTGFEDLALSPRLVARLQEIGLARPTAVQATAIPVLIDGHDAAVQSYTGSGKTLAYLLPLLTRIGPLKAGGGETAMSDDELGGQQKKRGGGEGTIEAVIVAPSRELGMQIVREIERIVGKEQRHVVQQLIGGASLWRQEEGLKKHKPAIVVGTPGRLTDLSRAGRLQTHGCKMLVLDEAEELLSPNFKPDMMRILEHVGRRRSSSSALLSNALQRQGSTSAVEKMSRKTERQIVLVSATMPQSVIAAAGRWGDEPVVVRVGMNKAELQPWQNARTRNEAEHEKGASSGTASASTGEGVVAETWGTDTETVVAPNIDHWVVITDGRHKVDAVRRAMHALEAQKVLVFMNFGRRLKDARFKLAAHGLTVGCLHGDMGKVERANVLAGFRDGGLRVLLVSDVAARGLDIADCDLVVNLELPTDASHYGHRAGRTGRIGKKGCVVSVCEERESFVLEKFAKRLRITILRGDVKEGCLIKKEVMEKRGKEKEEEKQEHRVRAGSRSSQTVVLTKGV